MKRLAEPGWPEGSGVVRGIEPSGVRVPASLSPYSRKPVLKLWPKTPPPAPTAAANFADALYTLPGAPAGARARIKASGGLKRWCVLAGLECLGNDGSEMVRLPGAEGACTHLGARSSG